MKNDSGCPDRKSRSGHGDIYGALKTLKAGDNGCLRIETAAEYYAAHSVIGQLAKKNMRFRRQVHGDSVLVWKKLPTKKKEIVYDSGKKAST